MTLTAEEKAGTLRAGTASTLRGEAAGSASRVVGEAAGSASRVVGEAAGSVSRVVGEKALRDALRKWRCLRAARRGGDADAAIPGCVYGVVVGDRLDAIGGDVEEIRKEIAWMRNVLIGAVVAAALATVLRFMGWVP